MPTSDLQDAIALSNAIELSVPLPKSLGTIIHIHLTINTTSLLLFLRTSEGGNTSSPASLGTFVYALPDRSNPGRTISTPLYTHELSLEFTTRLARLLAHKSKKAVYVGNSISFASAGLGGTVEEEMEGFRKVVEVIMGYILRASGSEEADSMAEGCQGHSFA